MVLLNPTQAGEEERKVVGPSTLSCSCKICIITCPSVLGCLGKACPHVVMVGQGTGEIWNGKYVPSRTIRCN